MLREIEKLLAAHEWAASFVMLEANIFFCKG